MGLSVGMHDTMCTYIRTARACANLVAWYRIYVVRYSRMVRARLCVLKGCSVAAVAAVQ